MDTGSAAFFGICTGLWSLSMNSFPRCPAFSFPCFLISMMITARLLIGVSSASANEDFHTWRLEMSYAQDEIPDVERVGLNDVWKFKADPQGVGEAEQWYMEDVDMAGWMDFEVPGVWNEGRDAGVAWNYNGLGWFRKVFNIPQEWRGSSIRLRFLAVYLIADVWLNGQHLGTHRGGYTAFTFEDLPLRWDAPNLLVVRADNTPRRDQAPHHTIDWWNCGGISREVYLERWPGVSLEQTYITTQLDGRISVAIRLQNSLDDPRSVQFQASIGETKASVEKNYLLEPSQQMQDRLHLWVETPRLWSPEDPSLYILKLRWRVEGSEIWRVHWERFGIRQAKTQGSRLFLNGEEIWLSGMAIHQDYPGMGSAVTLEAQESDLRLIKDFGCNFVRLGHYPFHPHYLDICDELGLLVWSEIPVWQNASDVLASEDFWDRWVKPQLDEMIDQQFNHPGVIFWSIGNEFSRAWLTRGEQESPQVEGYVRRATEYVRSLDDTRLVSYASAASTGPNTWQYLDVIGKPLHYGWFHSANVYDIRTEIDAVHAYMPDKPILSVENAAMSYQDQHAGYGSDERFSMEYHDKILRVDVQSLMARREFVCGVTIWTLADLKGGREKGTYGLLDRQRKVKMLYEPIRNLYINDPKLLILEPQTLFQPGERFEVDLMTFTTQKKSFPRHTIRWWITGPQGTVESGEYLLDIQPGVHSVGKAIWEIPEGTQGMHTLICAIEDILTRRVFTNSLHFDVGAPERPALLWVETVDADGEPMAGMTIDIGGFPKTTDRFGKVPFILNGGDYTVQVSQSEEDMQMYEIHVPAKETTSIRIVR